MNPQSIETLNQVQKLTNLQLKNTCRSSAFFSYYQLIEQTLILKLYVLQELILFKLSKMASFHAKFNWNTIYLFQ